MFKVEGKTEEGNEVLEVAARKAKDIWGNPSNFGFTKVYKVTAISSRRSRPARDLSYLGN